MILEDEDPHSAKGAYTINAAAPHALAQGGSSAPTNRGHALLDAEAALDAPPSYAETTSLLPFRPAPRARGRFVRAFLVALLVWALVGALSGSWAGLGLRKSAGASVPSARPRDAPPTPPPTQCIAASEWSSQDFNGRRHLAHHTFAMAREADILHLVSLSPFHGSVTIVGVNSLDHILVDVFGVATSRDGLDRTEVCVFENGTGLRVRATDGESALATLSIAVRLPRHPTEIWGYGALRTHLPMFEHYLEDLVGLTFQHVDIYSFAAPVRVPYITVANISIQATDAPVTGFFNVSRELSLKTSNGAISGHVDLWSTSDYANTSLVVSNHEAPITLDVNLRSAAPSGRGGQFLISTETTRGSSEMNVHSAPIDSRLDLDASTRHGVNRVKLPAAFEGLFSLRRQSADGAILELYEYDYVRDPAGEGRVRELMYDEDEVGFEGSIAWLPRHQHAMNGTVRMLTMDAGGTLLC